MIYLLTYLLIRWLYGPLRALASLLLNCNIKIQSLSSYLRMKISF